MYVGQPLMVSSCRAPSSEWQGDLGTPGQTGPKVPAFACTKCSDLDSGPFPSANLLELTGNRQVYNTAFIRWTTHSPRGLSDKDVEMAGVCDGLAKDFAELAPAEADLEDGSGRELVDKVVAEGGDCCVPPAKKAA